MTDEANLNPPQVVRITADIPAGVASQLSEVATLMNANRTTALHEAIVLANLLYSEAAKRGKVVVPQGSMQKVIYLPKVPREIAEHFGIRQGPMSLATQITGKIRGTVSATRRLFGRGRAGPTGPSDTDGSRAGGDSGCSTGKTSLPPAVLVVRMTADVPADVASQLSELATLMNANRTTALHEAIVLANLLYSETAKPSSPGYVVVKKNNIRKVINLPKVPPDTAKQFGVPGRAQAGL
jgi:hypothetical protein